MSKFNTSTARPAVGHGPVAAQPTPSGRTHEGGPGYAHDANMRSASLVGALEAAKAMLAADIPGARQIVDSVS